MRLQTQLESSCRLRLGAHILRHSVMILRHTADNMPSGPPARQRAECCQAQPPRHGGPASAVCSFVERLLLELDPPAMARSFVLPFN